MLPFISPELTKDGRLQINGIALESAALLVMPLARFWPFCQISVFTGSVCAQVDTMEMMRHPGETTNMRRQTVASYFRVGDFFFLYSKLSLVFVVEKCFP